MAPEILHTPGTRSRRDASRHLPGAWPTDSKQIKPMKSHHKDPGRPCIDLVYLQSGVFQPLNTDPYTPAQECIWGWRGSVFDGWNWILQVDLWIKVLPKRSCDTIFFHGSILMTLRGSSGQTLWRGELTQVSKLGESGPRRVTRCFDTSRCIMERSVVTSYLLRMDMDVQEACLGTHI